LGVAFALTPGTAYKTALAASVAAGSGLVIAGGAVSTTAVTAMPLNVSTFYIGVETTAGHLNALIHWNFYIPSREADATVQAITA
jgi:hypothetical protein